MVDTIAILLSIPVYIMFIWMYVHPEDFRGQYKEEPLDSTIKFRAGLGLFILTIVLSDLFELDFIRNVFILFLLVYIVFGISKIRKDILK